MPLKIISSNDIDHYFRFDNDAPLYCSTHAFYNKDTLIMNTFKPVSAFMTTDLVTVAPTDSLLHVKEIFDQHRFHHIPVVHYKEIVGLIGKSDFDHFMGGASLVAEDRFINNLRLKSTKAEEIMTKGLGKLEPEDRLNVALEIFCMNRFHALPVVKDNELVGLITPYDIMKALLNQKIDAPHMVYDLKD